MTPEQFENIFESVQNQAGFIKIIRRKILDLAANGNLISSTEENFSEIGDIFDIRSGFAFKSGQYRQSGTKVIRVTNFDFDGHVDFSDVKYFDSRAIDDKYAKYLLNPDDILMVMVGGSIGKTMRVDEKILPCLLNQNMWRITPKSIDIDKKYAFLIVRSLNAKNLERKNSSHGHFTMGSYKKNLVRVPPLEEQKRIVAKVDELMELCDELENTNQKTNRTKLTFLKSVTKHIADGAQSSDKQDILSTAFERAPKNPEGIQELKKVCMNFGIHMDQQSDKENDKVFGKMQELIDRMKADSVLPKSFLIQQSESELFSTLACLSLGSVAFLEKGKTGIKSAEPGEYPLVVTAAERQTCISYDFETKAAIVPLVSSTGHGHASINRLHYQSGKFALGTILTAVIPFEEELFSSRFIYEYLTTFKEELLVSRMTGTANVTLSVPKIAEVPIPMISQHTQKWICDFCETCDQLAISYKKEKSIQNNLLKNLV